ncbi:MAG: hypothetical protein MUO40_13490 [Anaerolineaceae bacterium]|nr:hypothetical protein [Anaerolineaceae bacterium]
MDILDSGSLKIQYNRNRYYDYYTERWLTHDPLGITPNPQLPNIFDMIGQYRDGLGLYEYVRSCPVLQRDPHGLVRWSPGGPGFGPITGHPGGGSTGPKCGICGPELPLSEFDKLESTLATDVTNALAIDPSAVRKICSLRRGFLMPLGWEWDRVHGVRTLTPECCGTGDCATTITIDGKCYDSDEVNYYLWGVATRLICKFDKEVAMRWVKAWVWLRPDRGSCKVKWAEAGWDGKPSVAGCTKDYCKTSCDKVVMGTSPWIRGLHPKRRTKIDEDIDKIRDIIDKIKNIF